MTIAAAGATTATHWLLFGHLAGLATLGAGLGAYVVGLHAIAGARTTAELAGRWPTLVWGEYVALVGYGLLIATGIGLGLQASAFGQAWLITSLVLLVIVALVGRYSGSRVERLTRQAQTDTANTDRLLAAARGTGIQLPADATVVAVLELVFLMTLRPGPLGIVVSLVVAALIVVGAAIGLRRQAAAHG